MQCSTHYGQRQKMRNALIARQCVPGGLSCRTASSFAWTAHSCIVTSVATYHKRKPGTPTRICGFRPSWHACLLWATNVHNERLMGACCQRNPLEMHRKRINWHTCVASTRPPHQTMRSLHRSVRHDSSRRPLLQPRRQKRRHRRRPHAFRHFNQLHLGRRRRAPRVPISLTSKVLYTHARPPMVHRTAMQMPSSPLSVSDPGTTDRSGLFNTKVACEVSGDFSRG